MPSSRLRETAGTEAVDDDVTARLYHFRSKENTRNDPMSQPTDLITKPRDVMPAGAATLPARYYVDADFFKREMDALFGNMT